MVLRQLRRQAGLTVGQVGTQLGFSATKVSRAETGERRVTRDDLIAFLAVYGAHPDLRAAMLKLHDDLDKPSLIDRGELKVHPDLEKWIDFEQDATRIRNYQPLLVPGLLQTQRYAQAVFEAGGQRLTAGEVKDRVAARIARQSLLGRQYGPRLDVVLHEAALHQQVGGPEVMWEQLGHLVEAAGRESISLRVIPGKAGAHTGMDGPFVITDYADMPSLVHIENRIASLYLEAKEDVDAYKLAYNGLLAVAHPAVHSVELIRRIATGLV
jgi:transcriptional regulator with XRE-family HTH domain